MFKNGDLVTGIDRSFERSIYRVTRIYKEKIHVKVYAFAGTRYNEKMLGMLKSRFLSEFRLAEDIDIKKATTRSHLCLRRLIYGLIG